MRIQFERFDLTHTHIHNTHIHNHIQYKMQHNRQWRPLTIESNRNEKKIVAIRTCR